MPSGSWTSTTAARAAFVAAGYFVAGKLGMLLATAPGDAAPVWPAAGIALAGMLACGARVWPGIVLGCLAASFQAPPPGAPEPAWRIAFAVALAMGAGAALQAWIGALGIRRHVRQPIAFLSVGDILRFIVVGGPLACVVAASVGMGALAIAGLVAPADVPLGWFTWWVGDTIGVVLVAPLLLLWKRRPSPAERRRWLLVSLPVAAMAALMVVLFVSVDAREKRELRRGFDHRIETLADELQEEVDHYLEALGSIRRYVASTPALDRAGFSGFVRPMLSRLPGIHALGWDPHVRDEERAAFEAAARREGFTGYEIRSWAGPPGARSPRRADHVVVRYVEPLEKSTAAIGVDVASDPVRREALLRARATGRPAATRWVKLFQDSKGRKAFVVFAPVGATRARPAAAKRSDAVPSGYVAGAFVVDEMMAVTLGRVSQEGLAVRVRDARAAGDEELVHAVGEYPASASLATTIPIHVANREWLFDFAATPEYLRRQRTLLPWMVLVGGFLFTSLLGTFLLVVTGQAEATQALVARRTAELAETNTRLEHEAAERRRTFEALRDSEARLHLALQSSRIGTWSWDVARDRFSLDDYVPPLCGRTAETMPVTLAGFLDLVHPDDRERIQAVVSHAVETAGDLDCEFHVLRPDLAERYLWLRGRVVATDDSGPVRVSGVVHDVTERHRSRLELEKAKEAAEAASRAKSEFVAGITHELRTPMNGMIGMVELALESHPTAEQRGYLEGARGAAESLLGLINDVLDFSKIEAGRLEIEPIEFRLRSCIADTVKTLAIPARRKGLELLHEIEPDVPDTLIGDPGRIRQILLNLLSNAVKFTERGHVRVRVGAEEKAGGAAVLRVAVEDTGIGIPLDQHERVFEAFTQAEASTTRRFGGTGLGLTISRRLARAMGGELWLESAPGRGTTFHFTAGVGVPAPRESEPRAEATAGGGSALLVLDLDSHLEGLRRAMAGLRMSWRVAASDDAALEAIEQAARAGAPFDLVVVDLDRSDREDDLGLVRRLRAAPELAATRVLVVTGQGRPGDAARCRELKVAAYLAKSMSAAELRQALLAVLSADGAREGALVTRHTVREQAQPLRILLAEDNTLNQMVAVGMIEKRGDAVTVVETGAQAVQAVEDEIFDVVLMDVQMPVLDGIAATAEIRRRERERGGRVTIVAMTASAMHGDRERCLEAGMDDFVTKPIRRDELFAVLERYRPGSHGAAPEEPAAPSATPGGLDRAALLEMVDGNLEALRGMAAILFEQMPRFLSQLRSAVARSEAATIERVAHSIRGSVGMWSLGAAFQAAEALESAVHEGDLSRVAELHASLEMELSYLEYDLAAMLAEDAAA